MARSSTDPLALRDAFVWTPGDGHRYLWDGASPEATVQRVVPRGAGIDLVDTGDRVPMVGVARTVTAFTAAVTAWRVTR